MPSSLTPEERAAMAVPRRTARLLNLAVHATTRSKWMFAAAIIGAGSVSLAVASHGRGAAAPIEQIRSIRVVPANVEVAHPAAAPNSASLPSAGISVVRFRFGFLEFEDDPDASAE